MTDTQTQFIKCPVCDGRGRVPRGFYDGIGAKDFTSTNAAPEICRACMGAGFIRIITTPNRVDVATPGTAHPLQKFISVRDVLDEMGRPYCDNNTRRVIDLCREHEQRIKILADALKWIWENEVDGKHAIAKAGEALTAIGPLPEGW